MSRRSRVFVRNRTNSRRNKQVIPGYVIFACFPTTLLCFLALPVTRSRASLADPASQTTTSYRRCPRTEDHSPSPPPRGHVFFVGAVPYSTERKLCCLTKIKIRAHQEATLGSAALPPRSCATRRRDPRADARDASSAAAPARPRASRGERRTPLPGAAGAPKTRRALSSPWALRLSVRLAGRGDGVGRGHSVKQSFSAQRRALSRLRCMKVRDSQGAGCSETRERTRSCSAVWASEQRAGRALRRDAREKRRGARVHSERTRWTRFLRAVAGDGVATPLAHFHAVKPCNGDDDDLISFSRNDALRRAGLPNLGNTCFIHQCRFASFGASVCLFTLRSANLHARYESCRPRSIPCLGSIAVSAKTLPLLPLSNPTRHGLAYAPSTPAPATPRRYV